MNIYCVMGIPHSGKTTFINHHFDNNQIILLDSLNIEVSIPDSSKAQIITKLQLLANISKARKQNKDVVFELPGLTIKERNYFLAAIKNDILSTDEIIGIWVETSYEVLESRLSLTGNENTAQYLQNCFSILEYPSLEEPFNALYRSENKGIDSFETYVCKQAKYHCGISTDNPKKAYNCLLEWQRRNNE